jgi:hypothetical protein
MDKDLEGRSLRSAFRRAAGSLSRGGSHKLPGR